MNITAILKQNAERYPDDVALIDTKKGKSRTTTYHDLEQAVGKTASCLKQNGLVQNDAILLLCPMSTELYIAFAAIVRAGMTAVLIDPFAGRSYLQRCCKQYPIRGLIASSKAHLLRTICPELRRIPCKFSYGPRVPWTQPLEHALTLDYRTEIVDCQSDTPALISFTSGSTGPAKGAVRSHGFLLSQHRVIEENLDLTAGQVELATLPNFVLANLASRVTSIIADADLSCPSEIDPRKIISQIQLHNIDRLMAVPAILDRVVLECERRQWQLKNVRKILTGGGPVSPRLLEKLRWIAPQAEITIVYGATEVEPVSKVNFSEISPEDIDAMNQGAGLLVGKPVASLDVRILKDHWGDALSVHSRSTLEELEQPNGQTGEIVVAGDHVLSQYLQRTEELKQKFRVEQTVWHRTGDAGYFDRRGRLWLMGRCEARINDLRGELYPLGIEQAVLQNPKFRQAALVSHKGKRVLAVTLTEGVDNSQLPSLEQVPFTSVDLIQVLDHLPIDRRHHSKIDYPALRRLLESQE